MVLVCGLVAAVDAVRVHCPPGHIAIPTWALLLLPGVFGRAYRHQPQAARAAQAPTRHALDVGEPRRTRDKTALGVYLESPTQLNRR
ncbi:hypothetical protein BST45_10380 [Mycobacterium shinjukuense]|uniref:Uncharacterized protein n=1 Tax=Mycobacterium shinjukuense TaxID=398694 RepID=A0A7I7MTU0_9MYCO|nr:hypothetical protein BST45_10380 [Mycobacterium shinjukuense]BBX75698.1 hypothetical protein MSHI_36040 [Mycobacterium shinjukuense]